jgi:hypothetical protein
MQALMLLCQEQPIAWHAVSTRLHHPLAWSCANSVKFAPPLDFTRRVVDQSLLDTALNAPTQQFTDSFLKFKLGVLIENPTLWVSCIIKTRQVQHAIIFSLDSDSCTHTFIFCQ